MSIINQLSSVIGNSGNEGEIALANQIVITENHDDVKELIANLTNKNKRIQSDCIKTIYEVGYRAPEMIADYYSDFLQLLTSKNNRLVWGSMAALATIADIKSGELYNSLELILNAIAKGSVITIDGGIEILGKLNKSETFATKITPILLEQLHRCPIKQLPQYLEKSLPSISIANRDKFLELMDDRIDECERDSQRKRLNKIIKHINELK